MTRSLLASLPVSLLAGAFLAGCGTLETTDDAGDAAFVQQVVPAVLGRKVRGSVELNVLTQIVDDYGRDVLLDVLFQQPEFIDYWSIVLMNRLQVQEDGTWVEQSNCFNYAAYNPSDDPTLAQNLVDHLRYDAASDTSISGFTMRDVLRAAIITDDLSGVYRAYMLTLTEDGLADDQYWTSWFIQTSVLGRDPNCQGCHTTAWSTTDDASWDRFHGTPLNLEKAVYGSGGDTTLNSLESSCAGCHGSTGTYTVDTTPEDGRSKTLSTRVPVLSYSKLGAVIHSGTGAGMPNPGVADANEDYILWHLQGELGFPEGLESFVREATFTGGTYPLGMADVCAPTVNPAHTNTFYPAWFAGQKPVHATINHVLDAYIDGLAGVGGELSTVGFNYAAQPWEKPMLSGPASLAWMTAARSVDTIAEEVLGARYTLSHGYARNGWASMTHDSLTLGFLQDNWSLQETLRTLVMSNSFNRRKPADSLVTSTAYTLLPRLNPWADVQPGTETGAAGENLNGTGDLVHRYSPSNLWWSTADGLGFFGPSFQFPNVGLQRGVGDPVDFYAPGFDRWSLSSLLWWETWNGSCNLTNSTYISDGADYPWRLLTVAVGDDPDTFSQIVRATDPTFRDLFGAMRDRLLGDPTLTAVEETQLAAMIAPVPLDGYVPNAYNWTTWSGDETAAYWAMEGWTRRYCSTLLKSPDYLLAGVAPVTVATNTFPVMEVCTAGEACGIAEVCDYWEIELDALGTPYTYWSCDETPGVDEPFDPVSVDAYEAAERVLAEDYGYTWGDAYAFEKAETEKAQAAEASLPDRDEPLSADEQRQVARYNRSLRYDGRLWNRLAASMERADAVDAQRFLASQELGFEAPQWAGEVPPGALFETEERERVMTAVQTAERECRSRGRVECPTSTWTEVTTTSSGRGGSATDVSIDKAYAAFEAEYERQQAAERVSGEEAREPEVKIEVIR